MSKAAMKSIENVEFPTFDASQATDQIRAFAEKGVEQSKEAYAKVKSVSEDMQKALEETYENVRSASSELTTRSIAAARTNSTALFDHLDSLVAAKSLSELFELQGTFVRKSYERFTEQAKDFQALSSKASEDVAKPVKGLFEKSVKEFGAAA